jgi:hypothetical protein
MSDLSNQLQVWSQPGIESRILASIMPITRGDVSRANIHMEAQKIEYTRAITAINGHERIPVSELERVLLASLATGLTWAASERNFYLIPRGKFVKGPDGRDVWNDRANLEFKITADGETNMRIAEGQFKRLRGPYVVYEGDHFEYSPADNKVSHTVNQDAIGDERVLAAYCFIVENDGTETVSVLDKRMILRLIGYSRKQNTPKDPKKIEPGKEYANELYFSHQGWIDPGFASTKCRYAAFRGRPKCHNMRDLKRQHSEEEEEGTIKVFYPDGQPVEPSTQQQPESPDHPVQDIPHQELLPGDI